MRKLRATVLGLGLGRQRALGYLQNEHVQLSAVCDVNEQRITQFLAEHPNVHGYTDYDEMLQQEQPDIANVSTPDWMHLEHALKALEHGCHVLLEKPMVRSLSDAETLIKAVDKSGLQLMVGQNYRRIPMSVLAKQLIAEGALGTIFHAAAETFQNKFRQFANSSWYASAEYPRAALLGTGIHAVDLLRFLIGEVEEAFAYGNHFAYPDFPGDDFMTVLYRFRNGVIGRVGVAYATVLPRGVGGLNLRLYGSKGSLENDRFFRGPNGEGDWEQQEGNTDCRRQDVKLPAMKNPFWQEVDYFVTCIQKGETPSVDVREGARNVAACLAGVESAKIGRPIKPTQF